MKSLANLDFIRSVAVLFVVIAHTTLYAGVFPAHIGWIGQAGVYIFFVHTSLVLMWSLERDPHPGRFYIRRIFRIFPLWLLVLFLSLAIRQPTAPYFAPHFGFYMPHFHELLANIFLLFDLRYGANVIGASWTLPIEVQMYVVLPCLFFYVRSVRRLWPLLVLDALVMVIGAANLDAGHTQVLRCIPNFLPGIMAYVLFKNRKPVLPGWAFPPCFLLFALLLCHFGSQRYSWVLCLVLGLSLPLFHDVKFGWLNRASHHIAKYSYGIYLTHLTAIAVGLYYLRNHSVALRVAGYLVALIVLPVLLYHLVEEPMIRLGSRLAKRIETGPEPPVDERTLSMEPAP